VETTSHGQLALWVGADEKPAPLTLVTDWQRMLQETR
jgi:hypothetical protein